LLRGWAAAEAAGRHRRPDGQRLAACSRAC
jgi:hypothetical protein